MKSSHRNLESLLRTYPRQRPELTKKNKEIYCEHYIDNRSKGGLINKCRAFLESWMHKCVADVPQRDIISILEVGAGNLNHVDLERQYVHYDIVEPFSGLYANSTNLPRVRNLFNDISSIPSTEKYDKILSVACLEHVENLPELVNKAKSLLNQNGVFVAAIPCEGELAWFLSWKLVTGPIYRIKYQSSYTNIMKHEHINSLRDIEEILRHYFPSVSVQSFPFSLKHLRLYATYTCSL